MFKISPSRIVSFSGKVSPGRKPYDVRFCLALSRTWVSGEKNNPNQTKYKKTEQKIIKRKIQTNPKTFN